MTAPTDDTPDDQDRRDGTWRVVLDRRTLPLPILRPITIGSDARNGIQLTHRSIRDFHARLVRRGDAIEIAELGGTGGLLIDGRAVTEALLHGGEEIRVGDIPLRIERGGVVPAIHAAPKAPPVLEHEFRKVFLRELRHAPWLVISLGLHALLVLVLKDAAATSTAEPEPLPIFASIEAAPDPMVLAEPETRLDAPPEVHEAAPLPDVEPDVAGLDDEPLPGDDPFAGEDPVLGVAMGSDRDLGLGAAGGGAGLGSGGFGQRGIELGRMKGPLKGTIAEFRDRGLDLVFLIDTTMSMEPFIEAAKRTVDQIITDLASLVPNVKLGIVAYRDEGDAYVTRSVPLSADRYQILNFLQELDAGGGGDLPEGILAAFEHALDELNWRDGSRRVIVLVGDAPPHRDDMARLRMRLRNESRGGSLTASAIFTGGPDADLRRGAEVERDLREIAESGGGEFIRLTHMDQVVSQIAAATLGSRFAGEVKRLLEERDASPRQKLVAERVAAGDVNWLMRKLQIAPVEPSVVTGLVAIGTAGVALRCLDVLTNEQIVRPAREAALYVLRRLTAFGGTLDPGRPLAMQEGAVADLRRAIEASFRK